MWIKMYFCGHKKMKMLIIIKVLILKIIPIFLNSNCKWYNISQCQYLDKGLDTIHHLLVICCLQHLNTSLDTSRADIIRYHLIASVFYSIKLISWLSTWELAIIKIHITWRTWTNIVNINCSASITRSCGCQKKVQYELKSIIGSPAFY